jgi:hypothetical protein
MSNQFRDQHVKEEVSQKGGCAIVGKVDDSGIACVYLSSYGDTSLFNLKIPLGSDPVPQVLDPYLDVGTKGARGAGAVRGGGILRGEARFRICRCTRA